MKKNKICVGMSAAALSAVLVGALSSPVSAKVDGILCKDANGNYVQYKYDDLIQSYQNFIGGASSGLYDDFKNSEVVAYNDDAAGYVDKDYLMQSLQDALGNNQSFNIDESIDKATSDDKVTVEGDIQQKVITEDDKEPGDGGTITPTPAVTVSEITPVNAVTVDNGTTADKLGLPATVAVTLSDGTADAANVIWDTASFDGAKAGEVTINGTLSVPEGKTWKLTDAQKAISVKVTVKEAGLAVSSVDASNLKSITVNFNKAVNKDTLTTDTVKAYLNGSATASTYTKKLSDDGKTLVLVFSGLTQSDTVKLALDGIKDADGKTITKYENTITVNDVTAPVVNDIKVINNKKFDITFSEPVNMDTAAVYKTTDAASTALLKVDGNLTFAKYTSVPEENKVTVELFSELAAGSHTVDISEVKDFAGFKVAAKSFTINSAKDVTAPKATAVKYTSPKTIEVTFDEDLKSPLAGTFEIYEAGSSSSNFSSAAFKVTKGVTDYKTVVLTTVSPLTVASTVGFDVKYKNVEDIFGNKTTEYTIISSKSDDDTVKPSIASYEVEAVNAIKVVFSEKVDTPTAANFALYKENGTTSVAGTFTVTNYNTSDADGKTFKVVFSGLDSVDVGNYKLKVTGIKDQSIRANKMDDVVLPIAAKDTKKPRLLTAAAVTSSNKIELAFSEAMDTSTAGIIANYFIDSVPASTISGVKVVSVSTDGKKVILDVPNVSSYINKKIAMPTLKDIAGNLIENASISTGVDISSGYTALAIGDVSVQATSTNTILVKIKDTSNYTFASADPQAFNIVKDGTSNPAKNGVADISVIGAQISQDGKSITLTLGAEIKSNVTDTDGSIVDLNIVSNSQYAVKDQNGTPVSLPGLDINDKIAPAVSSAKYQINSDSAKELIKSSDGATLTADVSTITSTDKVKINEITLTEDGAKIQLLTPYINNKVNGAYNTAIDVGNEFNSVAGTDGVSLATLQDMAKQDGDGDDSTLTITGKISDDANGNTTFGEAGDNTTFMTLKIKVK